MWRSVLTRGASYAVKSIVFVLPVLAPSDVSWADTSTTGAAGATGRLDHGGELTPVSAATTQQQDTLDRILEEVRRIASGGQWRGPGWSSPALESHLKALLDEANAVRAADGDELKLPITFSAVKPGVGRVPPFVKNSLWVLSDVDLAHFDNGQLPHARGSILLADGDLKIAHAHDCIIIARGTVTISHTRHCVVVAGGAADTGHVRHSLVVARGNIDLDPKDSVVSTPGDVKIAFSERSVVVAGGKIVVSHDNLGRDGVGGSRLMSGSGVQVSHARGSTLSAPQVHITGSATEVTFVNCSKIDAPNREGCKELRNVGDTASIQGNAVGWRLR